MKGFLYGKDAKPYGIYTVDADSASARKLSAYDGGATIAVKPTGFVVDISEKMLRKFRLSMRILGSLAPFLVLASFAV